MAARVRSVRASLVISGAQSLFHEQSKVTSGYNCDDRWIVMGLAASRYSCAPEVGAPSLRWRVALSCHVRSIPENVISYPGQFSSVQFSSVQAEVKQSSYS